MSRKNKSGRIFFAESITPARIAAVVLIAVGVALVGWGSWAR